jgi:DNA-binding transcriptional regulator YiaG
VYVRLEIIVRDIEDKLADQSPSHIDHWVGSRLRGRRLNMEVTQSELAAVLGVSIDEVERWEAGLNRIPPKILLACANALQVKLMDLFSKMPDSVYNSTIPINDQS